MELENGWLLVYHGVAEDRTYRLGAAILDKDDPGRVVSRTEEPILEPREEYERVGQVPNVVFSCGSVILDEKLLVSYGAADTVIGVTSFSLDEILKCCV
jgi:predicted GH43/DUF377 family glycosyl hydrolase